MIDTRELEFTHRQIFDGLGIALQAVIARRPNSIVYAALEAVSGRRLAIKCRRKAIQQHCSPDPLLAEAKLLNGLNHPNIIGFVSYSSVPLPFLATVLADGGSVRTLLAKHRPVRISRAITITQAVLSALDYLHAEQAIVHRDVKASNVLLGTAGQTYLADFDTAVAGSFWQANPGSRPQPGTVGVVSPEVLKGYPATPLSDIYAVGVLLYQLLCGAMPFEGNCARAVEAMTLDAPIRPPSWRRHSLHSCLDYVVQKALARNPEHRFQSAREFKDAIEYSKKG